MTWGNQTAHSGFILLGIFGHSPAHVFLFSLVLVIFTVALLGNSTMTLLICTDAQLHTPMYFLLSNLSLMDLMLICTSVPKMAYNYLSGRKSISLVGCGAQIFFYVSLLGAECFLLAAMAYDRYVAICHPLRYPVLMSQKVCVLMATSSWILGSLDGIIEAATALSFPYCGAREVAHFFCDVPALLVLSCADTLTFERVIFVCCVIMLLFPVTVIIASYGRIVLAVIRMGSTEGRRKAFATCSSHLLVVGMYFGPAMYIYMRPMSGRSPAQDRMVSVFYTILTPMLNPLIYSLRNTEVARALAKALARSKTGGRAGHSCLWDAPPRSPLLLQPIRSCASLSRGLSHSSLETRDEVEEQEEEQVESAFILPSRDFMLCRA
ncbi:olfactory receptor 2M3-like [Ctenodactylus gundi]